MHCSSALAGKNGQEFRKLVVLGPKGSFEPPVSEPKLKVEPINVPIISTHTWLLALLAPGGTDTHSVSPLHVLPARATYTPSPARATLGNVDRTQGSSLSRLWGLGATSPTTCQQVFRCCCIARSVNNIRDLWVGNSSVSNPDLSNTRWQ